MQVKETSPTFDNLCEALDNISAHAIAIKYLMEDGAFTGAYSSMQKLLDETREINLFLWESSVKETARQAKYKD